MRERLLIKVKPTRKRGVHRHRRQGTWAHLRELLYPTIGLRALMRLFEIRLKRTKGTTYAVAMGFAMGSFVSFFPFLGFHAAMALFAAWVMRGNYVASLIGTLVGNPWTFPLIFWGDYKVGTFLMGRENPLPLPKHFDFTIVWNNLDLYLRAFIWPMSLGAIVFGGVVSALFYWLVYDWLVAYRTARHSHLSERREMWQLFFRTRGETAENFAEEETPARRTEQAEEKQQVEAPKDAQHSERKSEK